MWVPVCSLRVRPLWVATSPKACDSWRVLENRACVGQAGMPSSRVWERSIQSKPSKGEAGVTLPPGRGSLRAVAVGVLEDVYDRRAGLQAGGVLGAGGDVVGLAGAVGVSLPVNGQVEGPGDDDAPLGAVGVRGYLELLFGAEKDRLAVGTGDHAPLEALEGGIDLGEALDPVRVRVHRCSFPGRSRRLRRRHGRHYTGRSHRLSEQPGVPCNVSKARGP